RVAQRPIRPPAEPTGMLLEPGMVGRALDREVEGDLETVLGGRALQPAEVLDRPERRMDGIVPALGRPDRIRTAEVARLRPQAVVTAFAITGADRVNGRKVENVEAHVPDRRQQSDYVVEAAVMVWIISRRARKQLVPAGKACLRALDLERQARLVLSEERAVPGGRHGGAG